VYECMSECMSGVVELMGRQRGRMEMEGVLRTECECWGLG
jgi:hypothetical protein